MKWNKKQTTKVILRPQCVCVSSCRTICPQNKMKNSHRRASAKKPFVSPHSLPPACHFSLLEASTPLFWIESSFFIFVKPPILSIQRCQLCPIDDYLGIFWKSILLLLWWTYNFENVKFAKNGQLLNSGSFDCVIFHLAMKWAKLVTLIIINTIATTMYLFQFAFVFVTILLGAEINGDPFLSCLNPFPLLIIPILL